MPVEPRRRDRQRRARADDDAPRRRRRAARRRAARACRRSPARGAGRRYSGSMPRCSPSRAPGQVDDLARRSPPRGAACGPARHNRRRGRSRCPGCRAWPRRPAPARRRSRAPAPWAGRRAESAENRAARAWSRTGNSSGRAPDRRRGAVPAPSAPIDAADIMAGRQAIRAEIAREREQVGELRPHVALDAGDRRAPGEIFVGETVDHLLAEARLVIEHVMRDAEPVAHRARVADVARPRSTRPRGRPPRRDRRAAA